MYRFFSLWIFSYLWLLPNTGLSQVVLNEVQSSNNATITDEDGEYEDWIELFNTSSTEIVDLSHFGLSDDYNQPFRWIIPGGTTLAPKEFLIVWASGKNRRNPEQPLHTNFSIIRNGEEILLTHPKLPPDEHLVDEIPSVAMPSDVSYGRATDGSGEWVFFDQPTPGASNTATPGLGTLLDTPNASPPGGFHTGPLFLEVDSEQENVVIRYTLDGSEPTSHSPLYIGPIFITNRSGEPNDLSEIMEISHSYAPAAPPFEKVFKGTVVRARAFRDGDLPSPAMTETYFIDELGHERYSFPVVTLNTNRKHLFDHEKGIYVLGNVHEQWLNEGGDILDGGAPANYNRTGREWERPAHFTLFEKDGSKAIDQDIGIRIHGGWARAFPQKSFRLYSRSDYGTNRFNYRVFPQLELDDFNRLILRNSGQDVTSTMFRDVYIQESVKHMNFDIQHYRPVVVFLNGEYWGIYNIRQRYDRHYIETHYGVHEDELDLLTRSAANAKEGSPSDYIELRNFIDDEDMSIADNYEYVKTQIDIENFIDYFIAQIFASNTDWPHNNIDFWRKNHGGYFPDSDIPEHDGRWRWLMFDTDFGFGWWSNAFDNTIRRVTGTGRYEGSNILFDGLMDSQDIRHNFYNRFADMLNTTFKTERMASLLDSLKAVYAPEIEEHINRRGDADKWNYPLNYNDWLSQVDVMYQFVENRPGYQWQQLMNFDDRDTFALILDVSDSEHGHIMVNTIFINPNTIGVNQDPWPWRGYYFKGIPVTLTAKPEPGYEFVRWLERVTEDTDPINDDPDKALQCVKYFTFSTEPVIEVSSDKSIHLVAEYSITTSLDPPPNNIPKKFELTQNYPNPFNPLTVIRYDLPVSSEVHLEVFDLLGRPVATLVATHQEAGTHQTTWNASGHASGIYIYRLRAGDFVQIRRMTLIN